MTKNPTDTNQASELYELCKKVYELTGWEAPETYKAEDGNPENDWQAYDTDYLLEKLPPVLLTNDDPLRMRDTWTAGTYAWYENEWITDVISDTPLKALLKLTIALSEAGELK